MHIPVDIEENGEDSEGDSGRAVNPASNLDDEVPVELRGSTDKLHISRKAITKYGMTTGCAGCDDLARRGYGAGKLIYHHSDTCRNRIVEHMKADPEYRRLLEKHGYTMELSNLEIMTVDQVRKKKHQVQRAIMEIETRNQQYPRSVREVHFNNMMRTILFEQMDVAEVYSPPRIAEAAQRMGLRAGWSLDLITCDENGRSWDFNCPTMRNAAARKVLQDKPRLFIGSPMGGPSSTLNNFIYSRMTNEEKQQGIAYDRKRLEFCARLYDLQWKEGRDFLHEHPESATSWQEECIVKLLKRQGVTRLVGDQCMYGLKSYDGKREGPARQSAGFMNNSICIAKRLNLRCPNRHGVIVHDHIVLINGRPKVSQVYPEALCRAVCKVLMEQIEMDRATILDSSGRCRRERYQQTSQRRIRDDTTEVQIS